MNLRILITGEGGVVNTAPYFEYAPSSFKLFANTQFIYEIPPIKDDQSDLVFTLMDQMPSFSEMQNNNLVLKPKTSDIGIYSFNIILKDMNTHSKASTYNFSLEITDEKDSDAISSSKSQQYLKMTVKSFELDGIEIKKSLLVNKVEAYIADIDQFGIVKVVFETDMLVPNNLRTLLELSALKFYLKKPSGEIMNLQPQQVVGENNTRILSESNEI